MSTSFEDLRILQAAEKIADGVWDEISGWSFFARDVVGKQMARSADSIGANIAESFGRYHYGEKLNFLYYARGSLFETKYWLNRSINRQLISASHFEAYSNDLTQLAKQVNSFARSLKRQKRVTSKNRVAETTPTYHIVEENLFTQFDLDWLQTQQPTRHPQSIISNS
ncbi:MAG: four helix bundle protein [Chloroflexota bacterium]